MKFEHPLISGKLIRRYKRFLVEIAFDNDLVITAHCPNSGSMMGLLTPGNPVYFWDSKNPNRKYPFTWELVRVDGYLVGINTNRPNYLVKEAVQTNTIEELQGYTQITTEIRSGENNRLDLLLQNDDHYCFVEVKNVTLVENGIALFPDAITQRGVKHLHELSRLVEQGHRGVVCFVIQRMDSREFQPAWSIDPAFCSALIQVVSQGVEVIAYQADVTTEQIKLVKKLPIHLQSNSTFISRKFS